jgi:5-enolpyruvylshikimate-3-phosphate synthase
MVEDTLDALRACRTLGLLIVWENDRASRVSTKGRRGREWSHIGVALIDITRET